MLFVCGCHFGIVPMVNPQTGEVAQSAGVRPCDEHKPSEIALNPEPWSADGLTVEAMRIVPVRIEENRIVQPSSADVAQTRRLVEP